MVIEWLGHSAFLIITDTGTKILTDPYQAGAFNQALNYRPIAISPDIVTVSHSHADHGSVAGLPNHFEVLTQPSEKSIKGIRFKGVRTHHDSEEGAQRGENVVWVMTVDHVRICHLGDLGHELSRQHVEAIGEVDVVLIPVGGTYTIGPVEATSTLSRLDHRIAIPMHFRTSRTTLPLRPVEDFLVGKENVVFPGSSQIELTRAQLPDTPTIYVLNHAY